jgi:NAD(P)H-quinone oxidoreductase subunit 5
MLIRLLPWFAILPLLLAALAGFLRPGCRPKKVPRFAALAALIAFGLAIIAVVATAWDGPLVAPLGLDRLDPVSVAMMALVTFIGWVVLRYAATYLDGEARQGLFTFWLCLTLVAVLLLVTADTLVQLLAAWMASSWFLQRLLLFYPERAGARRAARKKFIMARGSDLALLGACVLLIGAFHTIDLGAILAAARAGAGGRWVIGAAWLLGLAACLKSAQMPTQGWLTEVMETPTPVSALLHAGVINGGGFLLIRFATVMIHAKLALGALVLIGGFTALNASLVMLTQPMVKTSLAWSTVAQMGFMIFECGLGLFALALLHILAHSLYKAHSFLASGGAVERVAAIQRPGPVATPNAGAVARAFLVALILYGLVGFALGFADKSPQAVALGAILIFGVAYMLAQGFADAAPKALTRRTAGYALAVSISYFALQAIVTQMTASVLPPPPTPGALQWMLIGLAVISFGLVAIVQAMFPLWADHPAAAGLRVHLSNGWYANAALDRLMGTWSRSIAADR